MGKNNGQMGVIMKGTLKMGKKMVMGYSDGKKEVHMTENLKIIKSMGRGFIFAKILKSIKDNGLII